jgi:uncharacterized membrane protein
MNTSEILAAIVLPIVIAIIWLWPEDIPNSREYFTIFTSIVLGVFIINLAYILYKKYRKKGKTQEKVTL